MVNAAELRLSKDYGAAEPGSRRTRNAEAVLSQSQSRSLRLTRPLPTTLVQYDSHEYLSHCCRDGCIESCPVKGQIGD